MRCWLFWCTCDTSGLLDTHQTVSHGNFPRPRTSVCVDIIVDDKNCVPTTTTTDTHLNHMILFGRWCRRIWHARHDGCAALAYHFLVIITLFPSFTRAFHHGTIGNLLLCYFSKWHNTNNTHTFLNEWIYDYHTRFPKRLLIFILLVVVGTCVFPKQHTHIYGKNLCSIFRHPRITNEFDFLLS